MLGRAARVPGDDSGAEAGVDGEGRPAVRGALPERAGVGALAAAAVLRLPQATRRGDYVLLYCIERADVVWPSAYHPKKSSKQCFASGFVVPGAANCKGSKPVVIFKCFVFNVTCHWICLW